MSGGGGGGGASHHGGPGLGKASVKHAALRATGGVRKEGRAAAVASLAVKALQAHAAKNLLGTGSGGTGSPNEYANGAGAGGGDDGPQFGSVRGGKGSGTLQGRPKSSDRTLQQISKAMAQSLLAKTNPEEAILLLCRKHPQGLMDHTLQAEFGTAISLEDRARALNSLLANHRLSVFQHPESGALVYKEQAPDEALKLQGLGSEERLVLQLIQEATNLGIWSKDIKTKSGLTQGAVTKALKTLVTRRIVKCVKTMQSRNRKVYMMFHTEPSRDVTGGPWYTNDESGIPKLDAELISCLRTVLKHFIELQGEASIIDVFMFLEQSEVVQDVKFGPEDVMHICHTLLYDCTVESILDDEIGDAYKIADQQRSGGNPTSKARLKPIRPTCRCDWNDEKRVQEVAELVRTNIADEERNVVYRMNRYQLPATSAFTSTPCGVCPVFDECRPGGVVSPESCVYFETW